MIHHSLIQIPFIDPPPHRDARTHTHTHTHHRHCHHNTHTHTIIAGKAQRLKEAKEEAAKEIEDYRKQRESQFQEQQKNFAGSKDDFTQQIHEESQTKLGTIDVDVKENKEKVIQRLLELVCDIQPELHINAKNV